MAHPIEYPYHTENRIFVSLNAHYRLDIIPEMILADSELKHYPLKARNCFIEESEWNYIKIFKVRVKMKRCLAF